MKTLDLRLPANKRSLTNVIFIINITITELGECLWTVDLQSDLEQTPCTPSISLSRDVFSMSGICTTRNHVSRGLYSRCPKWISQQMFTEHITADILSALQTTRYVHQLSRDRQQHQSRASSSHMTNYTYNLTMQPATEWPDLTNPIWWLLFLNSNGAFTIILRLQLLSQVSTYR